MPTKYTYTQVEQIFQQKGCLLQITTYVNQLEKLNYIASCGHNNSISLKMFMRGNGIKCKSCALDFLTYEKTSNYFESKNCKLCYTKEEFESYYKKNTQKLKYIASCGHENNVCWKNFYSVNQGIQCPSCVNKNTGIKLQQLYSGKNCNGSLQQEYSGIQYFISLVKSIYDIKKTFDGCKADIALKPKTCELDKWLCIQVKTTNIKTERGQYYFRLNNSSYEDCLLLCICEEDKRMWLIPYEDVNGQKTIGISKKSKYNKYEITEEKIFESLNIFYTKMPLFEYNVINIPTSKSQQQEQEFRNLRENKIDFIEFINHDIEGLVYDFKIGNKKVQEKVGSYCKENNPNMFIFSLAKYDCRINGKCKNKCYEEGDNDLYWLHCKNRKFYVIPESLLIEKGFVGKNCVKQKLYVSPTNTNIAWCNKYLFDYDNIDKERLIKIINN
jgi:hypothetical protein